MSTFLLEMALDEAKIRERLGARLLAERARRGGGNARRFPQPKMAEILGVTLRTYQDWEGGIRVPAWRNLEEIAVKLEIDVSELVGTEPVDEPLAALPASDQAAEIVQLRDELAAAQAVLARIEKKLDEALPARRRARASG